MKKFAKKLAKKLFPGWTSLGRGVSICLLFALVPSFQAGEAAKSSAPKATAEVKASGLDVQERAGLEAEIAKLKTSNEALSKELEELKRKLIETNLVYSRQSERLKRIESSAAAAVETLEPVYVGSREDEIAEGMRHLSEASAKLAFNTSSQCEELDATISELPMDKVLQARIRLKLDALRKESGDLAVLASQPAPPATFEKCRILDCDKSLGTVVLSAGYRDGVRNGLLLRAGPGKSVLLRVVATRAMASAAKAVSGDPGELLPGMEAFAGAASK